MVDDVVAGSEADKRNVIIKKGADSVKRAGKAIGDASNNAGKDSVSSEIIGQQDTGHTLLVNGNDKGVDAVIDENAADIVSEKLIDSQDDGLSSADKELLSELTKSATSTERTAHAARRERFLKMLGFDVKEAMPLYSRMCAMRLDPTFALLGDDPLARIFRMDAWMVARRKVMPRPATSAFDRAENKRYLSIETARAKAAFEDLEELNKMLIFSHVISGRLEDLLTEQRMFEQEIEDRIVLLNRREDIATDKVPSWGVLITRAIEAAGFGSVNHVAIRDNLVSDIAGAIEKSGSGAIGNGGRRRLVEDILEVIEQTAGTLPDGNDQTRKGDGAYDRIKTMMLDNLSIEESNMAGPFAGDGENVKTDMPQTSADDDDDVVNTSQQNSGILAPAIDEKSLRILGMIDPALRAEGHGMISSIDDAVEAYQGFISQFVGTALPSVSYRPEIGKMLARIDERSPFSADRFSAGLDGEIDPLTWAKFEVPAGPYKLIQMKGLSSFLPGYSDYGMLPPVVSMEDAGNLLGITDDPGIRSSLKSWGPSGSGQAHTRSHLLDGLSGDPEEALEVCRKLVAMQRIRWKDPEDVTDPAIESIARWWLFLLVGRMRPGQIDLLWPDGFFHGVQGHDPICRDNAYFKLVRCDGGRIGAALNRD